MSLFSPEINGLVVALGIGLLVGLERERAKGGGPLREPAGIRSFILCSLTGAVAASLGGMALLVAGAFLGALVTAAYLSTRDHDPGLTTEIALLATLLLGALSMRSPATAAALGVIVAVVLASRQRLHRFSKHILTRQELHDLLLLAAAAFVVLPLLPDRSIDPWDSLNPRRLWILAVAVMAIGSAGYIALRLFGAKLGLSIAGLAGGFVSSTATIAVMADRARATPELAATAAGAALMSNVATVVQLAVVIGALSPAMLHWATPALAAAGIVVAAAAWLSAASSPPTTAPVRKPISKRPFEPLAALRFVFLLAAIMLGAAIAQAYLGAASLPWVLTASGLADVHAAAASAAQSMARLPGDASLAQAGLIGAFVANSTVKCLVAAIKGGRRFALRLIPGIVAMTTAFALAAHLA
ncbi:MgtC/SapB family protein [Lysobacter antibioticus]|uniref:MgtC family protein n=1 Tax=Lysobacter antibioticus TaxID=84531 RepID=A0A0S2FBZ6_LYSAN|nr:DUF4010 domain-containing protein [Lysobacter antibioticus]ALN81045.1 mgtC family protein [Lysobacter antibioticus]